MTLRAASLLLLMVAFASGLGCADAGPDPKPSGSGPSEACKSGTERSCAGEDLCSGTQACSGGAWTACVCAPGTLDVKLGRTCERDEDCGADGRCLDSSSGDYLGGAPPVGICVADCSGEPSRCEQLETASICVDTGLGSEKAYCFPSCNVGEPGVNKCVVVAAEGKAACSALDDDGGGFCRPLCLGDEDCTSGFCDHRVGSCSAERRPGKALGEACDPEAQEPECEGLCATVDGSSFCSHRCVFGEAGDCDALSGTEGTPAGFCLFTEGDGTLGDVGLCAALCDCNADCAHPDAICRPFPNPEIAGIVGRAGACQAAGAEDSLGSPCSGP